MGRHRRTELDVDGLVAQMVESMRLYCRYDRAVRQVPRLAAALTPLRDTHLAHAVSLARAAATDPAPGDAASLLATLAEAERAARATAVAACLAAAPGDTAVLGQVAAARAAHGVVLAAELDAVATHAGPRP